jgi:hypothetical protein
MPPITLWVPLYFLALWRCLDDASPVAAGLLGAAAMAVTLSNFYAGLITAVITPVAVAAYWIVARRADGRSMRRLAITAGSLLLIAAAGMAYASSAARAVVLNRAAFAFPRADLFRYSAKWWSYLVPPVGHPLLGAAAHRLWTAAGVGDGLLEQQVSLGWGIVALGLIAVCCWLIPVFRWLVPGDDVRRPPSLARVPVLVAVAVAALVCSLSPSSSWRHCWRASASIGFSVPAPHVRRSGAPRSWPWPAASTPCRLRRCGATRSPRRHTAGWRNRMVACGSSTARRSRRSPNRFGG